MATKRTKQSVVEGRWAKKAPVGRVVKEKFVEDIMSKVTPLRAMNVKQQKYIELVNTKSTIIATGYAGTSKTYIPTVMACDKFLTGEINKIIMTRPNISNSKSLGMFKGTIIEKMTPWLGPVLNTMRERLGNEALILALEKENIVFIPMEVVKGYSFSDCFVIVDEAEDLNFKDAKKLVTRQGKNCTMVLAGDITQSELDGNSGLVKILQLATKYPSLEVGHIDFDNYEDIVRSRQVKEWIKVFDKEGL